MPTTVLVQGVQVSDDQPCKKNLYLAFQSKSDQS